MTITEAAPPVTDPDAVDHTAALRKAGGSYARKQKAADTAREALVIVIRAADKAGMTKTAIADSAGVARETVYKALRGAPGDGVTVTAPDGTEGAITANGADLPGDLVTGERVSA